MANYLLRRLLLSALVVFGVVTLTFFILYLSGDPVLALLQTVAATEEEIDRMRRELGYDRPLFIQYVDYIAHVAVGDLGTSLRFDRPNLDLVLERLPRTLLLAGAGFAITLALAIPIGILAAVYRGTWIDKAAILLAVAGQSIPSFVLGPVLILVFAVGLRMLPAAGFGEPGHVILPAITLALYPMARVARLLRASLLDVLSKDYITTAKSKGIRYRNIVSVHALRNAALPVLTIIGLQLQVMLGGAVIVETVFGWPGIGLFATQALLHRDFTLVQAIIIFAAIGTVLLNLLTDLLYVVVDPRIRYD